MKIISWNVAGINACIKKGLKDFIEWLSRVFWKKFSQSIEAKTRVDELNKISIPKK